MHERGNNNMKGQGAGTGIDTHPGPTSKLATYMAQGACTASKEKASRHDPCSTCLYMGYKDSDTRTGVSVSKSSPRIGTSRSPHVCPRPAFAAHPVSNNLRLNSSKDG